eukprot:gene9439-19610_t
MQVFPSSKVHPGDTDGDGSEFIFPPVDERGVTLCFFQKIRTIIMEKSDGLAAKWTTTLVSTELIKPMCQELSKSCSLLKLLDDFKDKEHPLLGFYDDNITVKATIFISHAWSYNFVELVDALESFEYDNPTPISSRYSYWFDLFSNSQFDTNSKPYKWWTTIFLESIRSIKHTLLILLPWDEPITLTRAWCLFEIFCTRSAGVKLSIQLSNTQKENFHIRLRQDFDNILLKLSKIDISKSQSYIESDREKILTAVRESPQGINGLNTDINKMIREWLLQQSQNLCENSRVGNKELYNDMMNNGKLNYQLGNYSKAKELFENAHKGFVSLEGENSKSSLETMNNLATLLHKENNFEAASTTLQELHKYDEAIILYEVECARFQELLGADHEYTLTAFNNKGNLHLLKNEFTIAEELLRKAHIGRMKRFDSRYPETLRTGSNLALCLLNQNKNNNEATELILQAFHVLPQVLGIQHDHTVRVIQIMSQIIEIFFNHEDYKNSYILIQEFLNFKLKNKEFFHIEDEDMVASVCYLGKMVYISQDQQDVEVENMCSYFNDILKLYESSSDCSVLYEIAMMFKDESNDSLLVQQWLYRAWIRCVGLTSTETSTSTINWSVDSTDISSHRISSNLEGNIYNELGIEYLRLVPPTSTEITAEIEEYYMKSKFLLERALHYFEQQQEQDNVDVNLIANNLLIIYESLGDESSEQDIRVKYSIIDD